MRWLRHLLMVLPLLVAGHVLAADWFNDHVGVDPMDFTPPAGEVVAHRPEAGKIVELRTPAMPGKWLDLLPTDLDGDGQAEILLLSTGSIVVWRYEGDAFVEVTRLAFRRPYPERVTTGRLLSRPNPQGPGEEVSIFLSSARKGGLFVWKNETLAKTRSVSNVPVAQNVADRETLSTVFKTPFLLSGEGLKWYTPPEAGGKFLRTQKGDDFYDGLLLPGEENPKWAYVDRAYTLKVVSGSAEVAGGDRVGIGLTAVAGTRENTTLLLTSSPSPDPAKDHVVGSIYDGTTVTQVYKSEPLGAGVLRLRTLDYDQDGVTEVLALCQSRDAKGWKGHVAALDLSGVAPLKDVGVWE